MPDFSPADAMTLLRVLCGLWFIPHIVGKLRNIGPASGTFDKAGFRPPRLFVVLTAAMEILAATGLIFNVHARAAAALAVVVLLGAAYAVVKINGCNWRWQKQGPEFLLLWAAACVLSVVK